MDNQLYLSEGFDNARDGQFVPIRTPVVGGCLERGEKRSKFWGGYSRCLSESLERLIYDYSPERDLMRGCL